MLVIKAGEVIIVQRSDEDTFPTTGPRDSFNEPPWELWSGIHSQRSPSSGPELAGGCTAGITLPISSSSADTANICDCYFQLTRVLFTCTAVGFVSSTTKPAKQRRGPGQRGMFRSHDQ